MFKEFREFALKGNLVDIAVGLILGAAFGAVVSGTTLGMMRANVPAVLIGDRLAGRIPLRLTRAVAAGAFALLGALVLLDVGALARL